MYRVRFIILGILILFLGGCNFSEEDTRSFRIARDTSWYPLELMGKEWAMTAFTSELMSAIAREEGVNLEMVNTGSNALIDGLNADKYDGILYSLAPDASTRGSYFFSEPFFLTGPVLVVQMNSPIKSLSEMDNRIVGIKTGASTIFDVARYPSIIITPYDSIRRALDDLVDDKIDGVVMPALRAYIYTQGFYAGKLKVATAPYTNEGLRLITLKKPPELRLIEKFNRGLARMREDGRYDELLKKWGINNPQLQNPKLQQEQH